MIRVIRVIRVQLRSSSLQTEICRSRIHNRHIITLPRMIQSSSLQVSETFNLKDRGKLGVGYFADVIVFDEKTIADRATYENPEVFAEGMKYVIVNGKVAIDGGKYTGAMAGRALRKLTDRAPETPSQ